MAHAKQKAVLKIMNFRTAVDAQGDLRKLVARALGVPQKDISALVIQNQSIDARQKRVDYVYTLLITHTISEAHLARVLQRRDVTTYKAPAPVRYSSVAVEGRPVVIGCGPAGLFAAVALTRRGVPPLVIERGERVESRVRTVSRFWKGEVLDKNSNVLFGEGGAGTFSDGKLTTRTRSELQKEVLDAFIHAGADPEILYCSKPHLGTDRLRKIIPAIVDCLRQNGVEFMFNTTATDILLKNNRVEGVTAGGSSIAARNVFLATGHSARDIFRLLLDKGVRLTRKGFAVGMRIEHPQEFIDTARLGALKEHPRLSPSDYFMSYHDPQSGRGVYTFCMCPGGRIIGCATEPDELCTNGMSFYRRDLRWANAAVVAAVQPQDIPGDGPLGGVDFQRVIEQRTFVLGGGAWFAPAQRARDFVSGRPSQSVPLSDDCSYSPGLTVADLEGLFPDFLCRQLREGLRQFEKKLPGFMHEGVLVGAETRTSSPVRVPRSALNCHAFGVRGLIPVGEGAGYAGGIISSAVDGMQAALHFER